MFIFLYFIKIYIIIMAAVTTTGQTNPQQIYKFYDNYKTSSDDKKEIKEKLELFSIPKTSGDVISLDTYIEEKNIENLKNKWDNIKEEIVGDSNNNRRKIDEIFNNNSDYEFLTQDFKKISTERNKQIVEITKNINTMDDLMTGENSNRFRRMYRQIKNNIQTIQQDLVNDKNSFSKDRIKKKKDKIMNDIDKILNIKKIEITKSLKILEQNMNKIIQDEKKNSEGKKKPEDDCSALETKKQTIQTKKTSNEASDKKKVANQITSLTNNTNNTSIYNKIQKYSNKNYYNPESNSDLNSELNELFELYSKTNPN